MRVPAERITSFLASTVYTLSSFLSRTPKAALLLVSISSLRTWEFMEMCRLGRSRTGLRNAFAVEHLG